MPKSTLKAASASHDIIELLKIKISIPEKLTADDIRILIHDLRASANAFNMLVEDIELELGTSATARQVTKLQQLHAHTQITDKVIQKICAAISREHD